jgi:aminocarboxymuconate-semialdehyde decarboxylase
MIVDSHAHFVPAALLEELQDRHAEFPSVQMIPKDGSLTFAFSGKVQTRPVAPGLTNLQKRLTWMDENGIDRQVVAGWVDMFGNDLPPQQGAEWARAINRHQKALSEQTGGRLIAQGVLPTQDGALAATVLREAWAMGLRSFMIGTQPDNGGGVLDDEGLDPFWQAADELGAVVSIHPVFNAGDNRVKFKGMENAVGRITDSLIAVSRIIYSGHVEKYAGARIVVGIGGAALPYVIGRLKRNHALHPDDMGDPQTALGMLWYDTLLHDSDALKLLIAKVGADRVMLGSDMPFPIGDPTPRVILDSLGLSSEQRALIEGGLVQQLMGEPA